MSAARKTKSIPAVPALAERLAKGKAFRAQMPRSAHAELPASRRDPIALLRASNAGRQTHLVPIRYGRMLHSPFTFLRGSAALMAWDLGHKPHSRLVTQLCGDCHLGNFGGFASPERALLFGINDFDETLPGPFEWDIERLAASFVVAARSSSLSERICRSAAASVVRTYRMRMAELAAMRAVEQWYHPLEMNTLAQLARSAETRRRRRKLIKDARLRTSDRVFPRLTEVVNGRLRIADHPPLIYHPKAAAFARETAQFWKRYVETLPEERRVLLDRYRLVDMAVKVVGVGSVGTRCAIALLMAGPADPLFLQLKQARPSVLEPYANKSRYANNGLRVVVGQRILQATGDIFLGWSRLESPRVDYYVRQLRDMKVSLDLESMSAAEFIEYADACGWALARAHAKAADPAIIAGYLGRGDAFERAVTDFAVAYADRTESDHAALVKAVKAGRVRAVEG